MVWVRVLVGAGLLIAGIGLFLASNEALGAVGNVGIAVLATILGGALLFSPWVARLVRQLGEERRERIRNEERADMAAHLHDSVLQTLALIQRHADAPQQARTLARRQERELRAWLYDGRRSSAEDASGTLATALDGVADEVEADHGVAVDVVVVGDCPLNGHVEALVAAVREAVLNAARHSGADEVSVYAEVLGDSRIEAFVRDRGLGFDPAAVNGDRRDHPFDRAAHGPARWPRARHQRARRGHRGDVRARPRGGVDTVTRSPPTRVFLVDDHRLFLSGVRTDCRPTRHRGRGPTSSRRWKGSATPCRRGAARRPPAGRRWARRHRGVHRTHPAVVFLALSVSDAAEDVIAVIRAGARGYVTKTIAGDDLAQAVERAGRRRRVLAPPGGVRARCVRRRPAPGHLARPGARPDHAREREVLRLLARGYTYKEIARRLQVSIKTIETHVSSVLRKLQLSSRHELTRWATDRRLV